MPEKFDQGKVSDLARQIDEKIAEVENLRKASEAADRELGSARTKLANLRSEFTRAIDGQLDMTTLKQKAPQSYPVTP
jgi:chromosome segregation ATPase